MHPGQDRSTGLDSGMPFQPHWRIVPGSRFRWREWGADSYSGEDGGPVLQAERPHVFEFQWHPDGPAYATTVRIEFAAHLQGTLVRLTERGFRDTPAGRRRQLDCAAGWGEALALCKIWVEHGVRY